MWTSKNRGRYDRSKLRYPSDLTDDEWRLVEGKCHRRLPVDRFRTVDCREAILSFFLGRIGTLAADYFCGSRRFGRFGGFCGARGSGPGKADARLIAIGELDTGCLECPL